ncbi:MAG: asparagine synthase (glutamine-hydrolyzing) [Allosphingosinicella sp.]|uniref:asparagine synthase (glutamine-hydrolyzing) n=1 Tax=Allosphingosinicella sp. TaxID=2823234 RepID=UPI003934EE26
MTGFLGGRWRTGEAGARGLVRAMAGAVHHRGPDGGGDWIDPDSAVALGHRRLAVLDLSPAGEQPMTSPSGRYVTVYNGEIYNHPELRAALEAEGKAPRWRGHSDTETMLTAIDAWGIEAALKRMVGMFAIALWDRSEKRLTLARDRFGEKPLYYGWQGSGEDAVFLFGSELKSLARHPAFRGEIDRRALTLYTRFSYVPAPHSIYAGISKLAPGTFLTLAAGEREPRIVPYWSLVEVAAAGVADPVRLGAEEACDELEALLMKAVRRQMISDVPLGAFLSGGVDSSTVVALMQAQSSRPVKTFTVGFHEGAYNEADHAAAVARHLGTDHTDLFMQPADALAVIPSLPAIYDEPFADASQIPTTLVSRLARQHVTVSLSGDAADELFAGYNRYRLTANHWRRLARVPRSLRRLTAAGLLSVSPSAWDRIAGRLPGASGLSLPGEKIHKGAGVLASRSADDLYHGLVSSWRDPASVVLGGSEPERDIPPALQAFGDIERMMALDQLTYLPDDILTKVDRAAMSVSLETRVPFLDHEVVEYGWRLPLDYKLRGGETKWALRQILYRHVPRELIERPKMGFGIPIDDWLRGPLRPWAEALLDPDRLRQEGYFDPAPIRRVWDAHQSGQVNSQYLLWTILMFQSWLEARGNAEQESAVPREAAFG